ncbi:hypothetical protein [Nonomuraea sp. NPDC049695]|uniref:hypothetical protein n=1 Tax=Nonomuraea sp. NPDC049695 TaxID=3154734 RepID=UPI003449B95A
MIEYALGEVQDPETPTMRHAVVEATPGEWARAACPAAPRVWVHAVAGDIFPFPGPLGEESACCPACVKLAFSAMWPAPCRNQPPGTERRHHRTALDPRALDRLGAGADLAIGALTGLRSHTTEGTDDGGVYVRVFVVAPP